MTLAMSLGMSIGVRRTLWMMLGEVIGVASVAAAAVLGVAALLLKSPVLFEVLKYAGAIYLFYIAWGTATKIPHSLHSQNTSAYKTRSELAIQGFVTAVSNPKGWAFMVSLLPAFINESNPLAPQLLGLLLIIGLSEFVCMLIYATGGRSLAHLLQHGNNLKWMNRIAAGLIAFVGIWLLIS